MEVRACIIAVWQLWPYKVSDDKRYSVPAVSISVDLTYVKNEKPCVGRDDVRDDRRLSSKIY